MSFLSEDLPIVWLKVVINNKFLRSVHLPILRFLFSSTVSRKLDLSMCRGEHLKH